MGAGGNGAGMGKAGDFGSAGNPAITEKCPAMIKSKKFQHQSFSLIKVKTRLALTEGHLNLVHNALKSTQNIQNIGVINHSIARNCELALQAIYSHLNEYLKSILAEMFAQRPLQIVDKAQDTLQFQEILRLGSYDAVCSQMIDRVFRKLEANSNRNTRTLIERILKGTTVEICDKILEDAVVYIEIRHLIVHNSGKMDYRFSSKYADKFKHAKEGNKFSMSVGVARKAIGAVTKLCEHIDSVLISSKFLTSHPGTFSEADL
jgi:hypothetical protein